MSKPMVPMIWKGRPKSYLGRALKTEDPFEAKKRDAKIFEATGLAEEDKARRKQRTLKQPSDEFKRRAAQSAPAVDAATAADPQLPGASALPPPPKETEAAPEVAAREPDAPHHVDTTEERIDTLDAARDEYKARYGRLPHHTWDAEKIREKLGAE